MGSVFLLVAALLLGSQPATAGDQATAPGGQAAAPGGQAAAPGGQPAAPAVKPTAPGSPPAAPGGQPAAPGGGSSASSPTRSASQDAPAPDLPVSLEHIRASLARAPEQPLLRGLDRKPDFQVTVEERLKLEELLWSLEYKTGPAPPGGLYAYEQQRLLWNKTDHPLVQPYAAFNSSQLVTLAVEGIVEKYAGGAALHALTGAERRRAEAAARTDVKRAIAEFCAAQSDRSHIEICWMGIDR
jgi:hypothetical protein